MGEEPTPFHAAQQLAAEAWGASRTWWLVNGASQGNHVALLALGHSGHRVVTQRNAHSSTIDALVMSGLRPTFVAPELDPELHIAHCMTPEALDEALREAPEAVGATVVSPTYFGAVADVAGSGRGGARHGVPLIVDEAWGAHLPFHEDLPAHALSLGADLVISSTHKIVGSLTQSAMIHLGHGDLISEGVVDRCVTLVESTSPNGAAVRFARRGAPECRHSRPRAARRDAARAHPDARGGARDTGPRRARRAPRRGALGCSTTTRFDSRSTCAERARAATSWRASCARSTTCSWSSRGRT